MVAGLDGSLAWRGRVGALSSAADRSLFVHLRGLADAVVVGAGTVRAEGYGPVKLAEDRRDQRRAAGRQAVPPVVVVSRSLELDWDGPLWDESSEVAADRRDRGVGPAGRPRAAPGERADVIVAGEDSVDLAAAMAALAERGMAVVLTEGGPTLLAELVAAGLLDELCLTLTPLFGGDPLTMAHRSEAAAELSTFSLEGVVRREDELYLRYLLRRDEGEEASMTATDPTAVFNELMGRIDHPMVVVTTAAGHARAGCLVGFHSQCGMEPPLYAIWLSKANHTYRIGALADTFAVHFLGPDDRAAGRAVRHHLRRRQRQVRAVRLGARPRRRAAARRVENRFVGRRTALVDPGSDHVCVVLSPVDASTGTDGPLWYERGRGPRSRPRRRRASGPA